MPSTPPVLLSTGMRVNTDGCPVDDLSFCGAVQVAVAAGMTWDDLIAATVAQEWVGMEALAGLAGTVGEATAGNVAAYGQSVEQAVASVRTWDLKNDAQRTFAAVDCGFVAGGSRFADEPDRWLILEVSFLLRQGDLSTPIENAQLAELLGIGLGERAPLQQVHDAVLARIAQND